MLPILQLVLENLTREGQAGNEDQRFTFAMRKPPNKKHDAEKNAVIISLEKDEQSALSPQKCTT